MKHDNMTVAEAIIRPVSACPDAKGARIVRRKEKEEEEEEEDVVVAPFSRGARSASASASASASRLRPHRTMSTRERSQM